MRKINTPLISLAIILSFAIGVSAQTTEFSYQGFLSDNSASANGNFDFEFRLFDVATGGVALGSLLRPNVTVTNGVFSVVLNFGSFPAADRFLEIAVRPLGGSVSTTLAPRSKLLSTPYSTNAINATNAVNAQNAANSTNATNSQTAQNSLQLGGVLANQYVRTNDARLTDARNPLPNSPNYINNSTALQTSGNFNISGNGTTGGTLTGNVVNTATNFNIGGFPVLRSLSFNLFAGLQAGFNNTTGDKNSFFGTGANAFNTTGSNNSSFGVDAGRFTSTGDDNSFFGTNAGRLNSTGNGNSFFGTSAGESNSGGSLNTFMGIRTGVLTTGSENTFIGFESGLSNVTGVRNTIYPKVNSLRKKGKIESVVKL